jgi:hypothetical protein
MKLKLLDLSVNFLFLDGGTREIILSTLEKHKMLYLNLSANSIEEKPQLSDERITFHPYTVESLLYPGYYINQRHGVLISAVQLGSSLGHAMILAEYMGAYGQILLKQYEIRGQSCCSGQGTIKTDGKIYNMASFSQTRDTQYTFDLPDRVSTDKILGIETSLSGISSPKFARIPSGDAVNCHTFCLRVRDSIVNGISYEENRVKSILPPRAFFHRKVPPFDRRQYIPAPIENSSTILRR